MSAADWAWLVGGTGAAGTVTYFSCVRPMLKGRGHCAMPMPAGQSQDADCARDEPGPAAGDPVVEIARLRAERDTLREVAALQAERTALLATPSRAADDARDGQS